MSATYITENGVTKKIQKLYTVNKTSYKLLDYIEATGTQWIDTGFTPNNNSRIVLDFEATDITTATNHFFGARNTTTSRAFAFTLSSGYWRMGYNTSSPTTTVAADTSRHIADLNKNVLYLDGTAIYTATAAAFTAYATAYIGAVHATKSYVGYSKIYSCQMYDNDVLVRDYVPCISPEGEIGMLDKLNNTFYSSAGTEAFVMGNEIGEAKFTEEVKKLYKVKNGITHLCYAPGLTVSYSGTHEISDITVNGAAYKLWKITGSGALEISDPVEYWMCGGGGNGGTSSGTISNGYWRYYAGGGGGGGSVNSGTLSADTYVVTIGAAKGNTTIKPTSGSTITAAAGSSPSSSNGGSGGSGGGGGTMLAAGSGGGLSHYSSGSGKGVTTYPFGITSLYAHSGGGGGGGIGGNLASKDNGYNGGTNGGNGGTTNNGAGGARGGGAGSSVTTGANASFYGSGGGGGGYSKAGSYTGYSGGSGYQGILYLLIPAALLAA